MAHSKNDGALVLGEGGEAGAEGLAVGHAIPIEGHRPIGPIDHSEVNLLVWFHLGRRFGEVLCAGEAVAA